MNRFNKRTAVLDGLGFPDTLKVEEIASRIVNCFGSVNVLSIQFTPGRAIRVTFESEPLRLLFGNYLLPLMTLLALFGEVG